MLGRKGRRNAEEATSPSGDVSPARSRANDGKSRKRKSSDTQGPPRPWRVLIAGDDADSVELLARLLDAAGHEIVIADTRMEVLGLVVAGGISCVVLDMTRSGTGDANNVLVALRSALDQGAANVPIVLCGSRGVNEIFAWDTGADEVIRRPFRPETLEDAIESAVVRPSAERPEYRRYRRAAAMDGA